MPKAAQNSQFVMLKNSNAIGMKLEKYCYVTTKVPFFSIKTLNIMLITIN